jgi:quercetin dioxygenase-like cupin family protein
MRNNELRAPENPLGRRVMSITTPIPPSIVPPAEAKTYQAFGDTASFQLTGEETGGSYTMFVNVTAPGGGPPPHRHEHEDEWFYVVEGRAEFFQDGAWTAVPAGTVVFMPRGSVHAFRNAGDTPLKQIIHTAPSGFETFFARIAEEFHREGGPDMDRVVEISAEHGIFFA